MPSGVSPSRSVPFSVAGTIGASSTPESSTVNAEDPGANPSMHSNSKTSPEDGIAGRSTDLAYVDVNSLPNWMRLPFVHLRDHFEGDDESLALRAWIDFESSVVDISVSFLRFLYVA